MYIWDYTFDRAVSFVVDFGTSLKINLTDLSETFNGNEEKINSITVKNQTNGKTLMLILIPKP